MQRLFPNISRCLMVATCSAALALTPVTGAMACTSFLIQATGGDKAKTADGGYVYGRTMEFGVELESTVSLIPRTFGFKSRDGDTTLTDWDGKYAVIGMNALEYDNVVVDGVNEKGLAAGALYFPGFASYASEATSFDIQIAPIDFLAWILTQFETVDEVKEAIKDVRLMDVVFEPLGEAPPMHFTVHDRFGNSIVIEPIGADSSGTATDKGKLKVYDNDLGVLTNSPQFSWHMTNLRNYVDLSPNNPAPKTIFKPDDFKPLGEGAGMLGLPGDVTPPSRFVRVAAMVTTAEMRATAEENLNVAAHILNNFDIPKGFARGEKPESQSVSEPDGEAEKMPDYTQWTAMADLQMPRYFVRKLDALNFNSVTFDDFDKDGTGIKVLKPLTSEPFTNLSDVQDQSQTP